MNGAFHISFYENLRTHPVLGYLAGWVDGAACSSPAVSSQKTNHANCHEVLYVMSGMGRLEVDKLTPDGQPKIEYSDIMPKTTIKFERNATYRLQPSPDQQLDVRRVA